MTSLDRLSASPRPLRAAFALAAIMLPLSLAGCGSDPETKQAAPPPPSVILKLDFSHVIDGEPIHVGEAYTTRYKQDVTFDHLRYWVTGVGLARGDERFIAAGSYFLVEQTKDRDRLSISTRGIPPGMYDTLIFHIGVDPPHNKSLDLAEGELAAGLGMDWSWDTGYKFVRTEGQFVQKELTGKFSFHTGNDVLYKELSVALPAPVELVEDQELALSIKAEVDRIFAGVQLASEAEIAGGTVDSPAAKVAGNFARMFRLVAEDGAETALTATSPNVDTVIDNGDIPSDSTPPVLSEPVIALSGALVCAAVDDRPVSEERGCMTPFQYLPESGATYDAGLLTFVTNSGEPVHASAAGIVQDIIYIDHSMLTHSDIFTVSLRPNADSAFFMEYLNVKNIKVAEGDTIAAGQVIAEAGDYWNETTGLVGFGVRRSQELTQRMCPTRYTTAELADTYGSALGTSNGAWPSHENADLCSSVALLCTMGKCDPPSDFVPVLGDIDEGRRVYKSGCAICHGDKGEGDIGPKLCFGASCECKDCKDFATMAASITSDMPPEGHCDEKCSADTAAFIMHEFAVP